MRRLILQMTDAFWLEQLETMDYLRRTVSLRAYGQRDPLIEYRREGLQRFQDMEAGIAQQIRETIPHVIPADDSRIRAQEERTRRALIAASEGGDGSEQEKAPIVKANEPGRNDTVTIRKGEETQTLKYKKAEPLLAEGWVLEP
jgi:preprotein translocase subunit SecA